MIIRFEVTGKPIPQQRPRVMRGGWAFDPIKCKQAKALIALVARKVFVESRLVVSKADFSVSLIFHGANPLADLDNLTKLVLDALKGIFWEDDRQVVHIEADKLKCVKGMERTYVEINMRASI